MIGPEPSDAQIMRAVQAGEVAQFDLLVERYRGALLRVARSKLGPQAWAEDVVQEAFLAAFVARHTYQPQYAFRTWLWTILLNLCRKQWGRDSRRPAPASLTSDSEPAAWQRRTDAPGGLAVLLAAEQQAQVHRMLTELSEPQADAIRLRFFGELSYEEIAATMNSSISAAKQRVRVGLEKLAGLMKDESGESA